MCNAIGGISHSLCAAVSLPEGSVFRLKWPETEYGIKEVTVLPGAHVVVYIP